MAGETAVNISKVIGKIAEILVRKEVDGVTEASVQTLLNTNWLSSKDEDPRDLKNEKKEKKNNIIKALTFGIPKIKKSKPKAEQKNTRAAMRAAMLLAWYITEQEVQNEEYGKEHALQMKDMLNEWTKEEIETQVYNLWKYQKGMPPVPKQTLAEKAKLLQDDPLAFLRTYSLWPITKYDGKVNPIALIECGAEKDIHFLKAGPGFYGLTLKDFKAPEQPPADAVAISCHCLPWATKYVTHYSLNGTGSVLFITAGLNGCSVFIKGTQTSPTVYHAGIDGKTRDFTDAELPAGSKLEDLRTNKDNSIKFWQLVMDNLGITDRDAEVNKGDYGQTSAQVEKFKRRMSPTTRTRITREIQVELGCVVGIRDKGNWAFYLQVNVVLVNKPAKGNQINVAIPILVKQIFPETGIYWDGMAQLLPNEKIDADIKLN